MGKEDYICTMEYHSVLNEVEILTFTKNGWNLDCYAQQCKADPERQMSHIFSHMWKYQNGPYELRIVKHSYWEEQGTQCREVL